jgi:DNA-binding MurR/RpiR family transcriptional regulator
VNDIIDIVARLRERSEDGSKSDRRLAQLILDDIDYASKAAIADLASRAEVSEPTVTRFCRGLGCEGTRDFKFKLAQALAVGALYLNPAPLSRDAREERTLQAICDGAVTAIEKLKPTIDLGAIAELSAKITESPHVLIYGSGGISSMMAVELQNRLFRFRINAVSHIDGQMQRMTSAVADKSTLVIGFSGSGYARSVVDAVMVARQYGAHTAAVTAASSALAEAAHIVIPFQTYEDSHIYKPTSSRYALLAIVDIIATMVAENMGPRVIEGMRRIKQSLNTLKVDDPRLPLGD